MIFGRAEQVNDDFLNAYMGMLRFTSNTIKTREILLVVRNQVG